MLDEQIASEPWKYFASFPAIFGPDLIKLDCGRMVRLPSINKNCAALIGTGDPANQDQISAWGTGFFVTMKLGILGSNNLNICYFITARHVISPFEHSPFDIRVNKKGGGARNVHIENPQWFCHPTDNSVDVAIHHFDPPEWADFTVTPRSPLLLDNERLKEKDIGEGDGTYTVGLWKFLPGDNRNQPFVYSGHIGLMPEGQKIPTEPWLKEHGTGPVLMDGYLTEGEPLDGASGSPVFVRRTVPINATHADTNGTLDSWIEGTLWLLGLNHGAWFARASESYQQLMKGPRGIVPRGVNIVVPANKIAEVLDQPALVELRQQFASHYGLTQAATPASATGLTAQAKTDDQPPHKEAFTSLLNAAVRTKPQGD